MTTVLITSPTSGASLLMGVPVTYTCIPTTAGYVLSDHTCTWTFDDGSFLVGATVTKTWLAFDAHLASVVAVCNPTSTQATASVTITNILPGVVINDWLYQLKLDMTHYWVPAAYTAVIQRRNLLDATNHTFQDYATIPTSVLNTVYNVASSGNVNDLPATQQPWMLSGLYQMGGNLYLSLINGTEDRYGVARRSLKQASYFQLTGVDGSGNGVFTQVAITPVMSDGNVSMGVLQNGTYNADEWALNYSNGYYNGSTVDINTSPWGVTTRTITSNPFMTPYIPVNGGFTSLTPQVVENQNALCYNSTSMVQEMSGTISDSIGNSVTLIPNPPGYYPTTFKLFYVTGSLINTTTPYCFNQISFNVASTYGVIFYTLNTWAGVSTTSAGFGTPTSSAQYYMDNMGVQHQLLAPTTNGSDILVGVCGSNQAATYNVAGTTAIAYQSFYVCHPSDLTHHYTPFSSLGSDGCIYHIEIPEASVAQYWRDNTLLTLLNTGASPAPRPLMTGQRWPLGSMAFSTDLPVVDGTPSPGTLLKVAASDHVHPSDPTKANLSGSTFTGAVTAPSFNGITGEASSSPLMDGVAAVGISTLVSPQDHVHPSDTSREPALGNPGTSGFVLSSNTSGVRSWVAGGTGGGTTGGLNCGDSGAPVGGTGFNMGASA